MRSIPSRSFWPAAVACLALAMHGGCSTPPAHTGLSQKDVDDVAAEMFAKLQLAPWVAERNADSPQMTIVVRKVTNETRSLMTEAEQWAIMYEVAAALNNTAVRTQRRIQFTIPAERIRLAKESGAYREGAMADRDPTHVMDARFLTRTTSAGLDRTDLYDCEFRIVDLKTNALLWVDAVRLKRVMQGKVYE